MRRLLISVFVSVAVVFGLAGSCGKGSDPDPNPGEANLQVTLSPANGSTQPAAPFVTLPLTVTVTSTMPPQGVQIDVSAKKDDGSSDPPFFTSSVSTSNAVTNFSITNTPVNVVCIVNVTVTSKTKATNKWTGNFRYSRKP